MEELLSYFDVEVDDDEERVEAVAPPPPPPPLPRPAGELIPVGVALQPATPTTVVVQVVPLVPDDASRRLARWAGGAPGRRRPWRSGRDRLSVVAPDVVPAAGRTCCATHVRIDVRGRGRTPLSIEVGCAAWSSTRAELHVAPVRAVHDRRRYYRAAHAVLDRLVRDLRY